MKIVLTCNSSPWSRYCGGGQVSTHALASALASRDHDVTVIYTRAPWERTAPPTALPYQVDWAPFVALRSERQSPLRPLNAIGVARRLVAYLDGPELIIHSQGEEGALVPFLRRRSRFGFVITPRYPAYPPHLGGWTGLLSPWRGVRNAKYHALGLALRGADAVCPTSQYSALDVARTYGLSARTMRVVPNGVAACFLERPRSAQAARGPVVFFGRLAAAKGVEALVEAWPSVPAEARLVIVGRGELEGPLRSRVDALGLSSQVRFEPWMSQTELARLLAGASMAVLPSREESFGNTVLEAMATGAPVICTSVGSLPELVDPGRTGLFVTPERPEELARAIADLWSSPSRGEALGRAARDLVRRRYSWDATALQYVTIFESLHR